MGLRRLSFMLAFLLGLAVVMVGAELALLGRLRAAVETAERRPCSTGTGASW